MTLDQLNRILKDAIGNSARITSHNSMGGGCINQCFRLNTSDNSYFVKGNGEEYLDMFKTECNGLENLAENCDLLVPKPIKFGKLDHVSYLLMEFVDSSLRNENYWEKLGEGLANMHRISADTYGWEMDNYIGRLPQSNLPRKNWLEFFIHERLQPQVKMAELSGRLPSPVHHALDELCKNLPEHLSIELPAFLHGDLWSGNIMTGPAGEPCLMDPAVYFGHREMELAFTTLFGGFENRFYQAYNLSFPLQSEYQERYDIYNLYPLLVHLNLFGSSYLTGITQILARYR